MKKGGEVAVILKYFHRHPEIFYLELQIYNQVFWKIFRTPGSGQCLSLLLYINYEAGWSAKPEWLYGYYDLVVDCDFKPF
ncbi:hypothetical protein LVD17_00660 [Fulvivirga ulvae]|uniref:hypothetical protein n=1 Tax=Fulvivirga ulvae TaxID=2904245 RepID=UPI001F389A6D|nr:hypothetical protein [Fulvivirga ulvae]UII32349.1 hypothetical protein LVD17_00660 [Fulvivirga ulvae]